MDILPPELLSHILAYLPKSSLPSARLVSRAFAALSLPILFAHLPGWLDYDGSHRRVVALAHDVYERPAVMWSPWASEPDEPIDEVFLGLVWQLLVRKRVPSRSGCSGGEADPLAKEQEGSEAAVTLAAVAGPLTPANFARLSGRMDMTERRLKTGQNRFLLYRNCVREAKKQRPWGAW